MKKLRLLFTFALTALLSVTFSPIQAQDDVTYVKTSHEALPDGNLKLIFDIETSNGWYRYSATPIEDGPMAATFAAEKSETFKITEPLQDGSKTKTKLDPGFGIEVYYFEHTARLIQTITPLASGNFTVTGTLTYQTCNGAECLINDTDVTINIKPQAVPAAKASKDAKAAKASQTPTAQPKEKGQSLWVFLLIAFAAGLGGVITPCVFPMIPMTVGFLVSGSNKKSGIMKGLVFGLSVTIIYTLLGLIVALFESTAATDAIGTHWIPNLIFAVLFLVFAISFLGAFEITLPSGLANKADRQADKGGYIAAFFVALAMVIVSFSCTGPFVGSILAASVMGGVALKPILGMAVFGIAFSLPFVIFSFFPGIMKKLPKSGGWLNVVKIVFAFILLAFTVKFFYNVDAYFGWGFITRLGFLSIWIALALLLGFYFLGIFHTNHDTPTDGIGWGKTIAAIICFSFAIYMIPGLFGAPLKSISGLIPPQDGTTITLASGNTDASAAAPSGYSSLQSYPSIEAALTESKASGKNILLTFKSHTCSVCKMMEATVLSDAAVLTILKDKYIIANLYVDDKTPDSEYKTLGKRLRQYEMEHFASASQPLYAIIDSEGNTINGPIGSTSLNDFLQFIK